MITITQAERLVRKIAEMTGQPGSDTQTARLAQDYADLCRAASRRLEQCAIMIEAGQFLQALQLAETPPPLLDLITVLSFRQAADWRNHCQSHQLPWSEPFYDKYVRLLNSAYGKGIDSNHPFYRDYRRAVLKNDDKQALSILRVIARMNPSDENTQAELKRLEEKLLREDLEKLRQAVAAGDGNATKALVAQIETSGIAVPSSHPVWQQAQVARCQELLRRAEELRRQDAWQDAEVLVDEIEALANQYNAQLPASDADAWHSLEEWTAGKRSAYADDQDFKRALSALEYEIQTIETRHDTGARLGGVDATNTYNSLANKWSEAERFGRPLNEELATRGDKCRSWLQGQMKAAGRRRGTIKLIVALAILIAIGATIPFVLDWARERDLALRLGMLESARRVSDTQTLLGGVPARLKTKPRLADAVAKAQSFLAHEDGLKHEFDADLSGLQQLAAGNFDSGVEQVGPRRAQAEHALAQLAPEFQIAGKSALNAWDAKWQPVRNARLTAQLNQAENIAAGLNGAAGFDAVHAALARLGPVLADIAPLQTEPPAMDRDLAIRLGELKAKTSLWTTNGEQWEQAQAALDDAQSLDEYLDRLGQLVQSPFASAAQRNGATEIDRLKISRASLLGNLLLPHSPDAWVCLTNVSTNVAEWRPSLMPEQPTAEEKELYAKLADDPNMKNVFAYQLVTNARPNNTFRNHYIFVRGSLAPDRSGQMTGLVYDPSEDLGNVAHFKVQGYSDWDYDYLHMKKLYLIQECETFDRLGVGQLIDTNTGSCQKPILQLMDQLNQETSSSAIFRSYVILKLFDLAQLRPAEWGLTWCPGAAIEAQALKDLGAGDFKSGDWLVRGQIAKYDAAQSPLQNYFAHARNISLEKQALFLQQLARETCATDFSYAGFVDVQGRAVLRQIHAPVPEYWGWGGASQSAVLLLRAVGGQDTLGKIADPLPFTPLFFFNGERRTVLYDAGRAISFPADQMAGILPPLYSELLHE